MNKIGIIGAGFVGRSCAQLFLNAGYDVMVSNSRGKETLTSVASAIHGCLIGSQEEAIAFADTVLIAIPFNHINALPAKLLAGKLVLDANNYYPERDGHIAVLDAFEITTSELLQQQLPESRIVKAFNAIIATELVADARPHGDSERRALPIAGDDSGAKAAVMSLHDAVGYDAVDVGPLAEGWRFERAKPAYCIPQNIAGLKARLADAVRDQELPHNSWYQR